MKSKIRAFAIGSSMALAATMTPTLTGPADAQVLRCNGEVANVTGTHGADVLHGTPGRDVIAARGGNDKIYGFGGNDVICGAGGNDSIFGGGGNDLLIGGDGHDVILGGDGADRMLGGNGDDRLVGYNGNDFHNGGDGRDTCEGGWGRDLSVACEVRKAIYRPTKLAGGSLTLAPNQTKTYFLHVDRGDWFFLDVANPSNFGSSEFPNYNGEWTLYDGFGSIVNTKLQLADTPDPIKIMNSGTHRLVFKARSTSTATFTFGAYRAPVINKTMNLNQRVSGSLSVPGATARHKFTGSVGNMVDVDFASFDLSGRWWLVRSGRALTDAVASGSSLRDRNDIRLPANGTYEIVIRGVSSATPNYSFTVRL